MDAKIAEKELVCGDGECPLCVELLELIAGYARADRQLVNAKGMVNSSWEKGVGSAQLVEAEKEASVEHQRRKDMLFMRAGSHLLERDRAREANIETSPLMMVRDADT